MALVEDRRAGVDGKVEALEGNDVNFDENGNEVGIVSRDSLVGNQIYLISGSLAQAHTIPIEKRKKLGGKSVRNKQMYI
jgi:hypothetical protein